MRTIEDIIASTQTATEAALREAYDAGRTHAASDLKSKMTAFFETLNHMGETHEAPHPAPSEPMHQAPEPEYHPAEPDHHMDSTQHSDGEQHSGDHHY